MITISCPVEDCAGEFELQVETGWQGDDSVIGGTAPIMEWSVIDATCEHDAEGDFAPDSKAAQRFADAIYERLNDRE